jgi:hypothetical protein
MSALLAPPSTTMPAGVAPVVWKPIFQRQGQRSAERQEADQSDQDERSRGEPPPRAGEPRARQREADEPQQHDQVRRLDKERQQLGEDEEHVAVSLGCDGSARSSRQRARYR